MSITDTITQKTSRLVVVPEITPGDHGFSMFNDAGTEVEVSEFLYALVRLVKPKTVLETGTHIGVSSTYIGQALEDNNKGSLITFEVIPQYLRDAQALWRDVGIQDRITGVLQSALDYQPNGSFDLLFLDSEPQYRFDEFVKFIPYLSPTGFIAVHDLYYDLGHHGLVFHEELDWPYGDFRAKIGCYIKDHTVQTVTFPTPRGFTLFQKTDLAFAHTKYLRGDI